MWSGKVEGKFYDKNGNPTKYYYQAQKWIKAASKYKEEEDVFKEKYPMCNVDYKPEEGTRVWCSTQRFETIYFKIINYIFKLFSFLNNTVAELRGIGSDSPVLYTRLKEAKMFAVHALKNRTSAILCSNPTPIVHRMQSLAKSLFLNNLSTLKCSIAICYYHSLFQNLIKTKEEMSSIFFVFY